MIDTTRMAMFIYNLGLAEVRIYTDQTKDKVFIIAETMIELGVNVIRKQ